MNHPSQPTRPAARGEILLRSKLYRPPPRADAVRRPRLTGHLDGLLAPGIRQGNWTAIQAGYAKSLMAHYLAPFGAAEALYGERLSEREIEVLALVAEGLPNAEIAARLVLATGTVRAHTASIYRKLDVQPHPGRRPRARAGDPAGISLNHPRLFGLSPASTRRCDAPVPAYIAPL